MFKNKIYFKKGFTLIELLVVISIIGILATLIISNVNEARVRARDVKRKGYLSQMRTALRLYYNDFQSYPIWTDPPPNGRNFYACGTSGKLQCMPGGDFSAGTGPTTYLKYLTPSGTYFEFNYFPCSSGEDYRIKVTLENKSDPDLAESQVKCPASTCSLSYSTTDYVVCP